MDGFGSRLLAYNADLYQIDQVIHIYKLTVDKIQFALKSANSQDMNYYEKYTEYLELE